MSKFRSPGDRHGYYKTPTWETYRSMLNRCQNPNSTQAIHYQDRGITVCERWQIFKNFLEDMGERPDGMTLDRIDNSKGYCKENCQWATQSQQCRNTRRTKLTFETATQAALLRLQGESCGVVAAKFGIAKNTVSKLATGKTWPDALAVAKKILEENEEPK